MKNQNYRLHSFFQLRSKGYPQIADVEYAMLEPIGEVSVIPKAANTCDGSHLEISIDDEGLPISVIIDGKIQYRILITGKNESWLLDYLNLECRGKDIIYGYINEKSKKLYLNQRRG